MSKRDVVTILLPVVAGMFSVSSIVFYTAGSDGILAPFVASPISLVFGAGTLVTAAQFERYYPWLLFAAAAMLAFNLRQVYAPAPAGIRISRVLTWISIVLFIIFTTYSISAILSADWSSP